MMNDRPDFLRPWMNAGMGEPIRKTMFHQMERFWEGQRKFVDEFESLSQAMLDRRRVAAEAALGTLRKMSSTTETSEWAQCMTDWMSESFSRVAEDSRDMVQESWKLFSGMSELMSAGIAETAKATSETQQMAARAATEQAATAQDLGEQGAASAQEAARLAAARARQRPPKRPEEGAKP